MAPRKTPAFTYFTTPQYPSDDEDNDLPPPLAPVPPTLVGQRHVQFNNQNTGNAPRRARNVYLPSIPSPPAPTAPHRSEDASSWNMDPPPPSDLYELYPFADPSYQHALDMMDPEVVPRRRTKSVRVSMLSYCDNKLIPRAYRTTLFSTGSRASTYSCVKFCASRAAVTIAGVLFAPSARSQTRCTDARTASVGNYTVKLVLYICIHARLYIASRYVYCCSRLVINSLMFI